MNEALLQYMPQLGIGGIIALTVLYMSNKSTARLESQYQQLFEELKSTAALRNDQIVQAVSDLRGSVDANTEVMRAVLELVGRSHHR